MAKMRGRQNFPNSACYDEMDSPVGKLTIVATESAVHAVLWDLDRKDLKCDQNITRLERSSHQHLVLRCKNQLSEYFSGKRKVFDIPYELNGTDFQIAAWKELVNIPYARTLTYAEQAMCLGDKNKARAVGSANGLNPISIIVPCHRVIGSSGKLCGFAGGLTTKAQLLHFERNTL